jgi:sugar phosphate isomerase/epimerase
VDFLNKSFHKRQQLISATKVPLKPLLRMLAVWLAITPLQTQAAPGFSADTAPSQDILAPQNLTAWCVVPFDAKKRGPAERAEMLQRLGFKNFAYDWRLKDVPSFDEEVDAMKTHSINLVAWWFPTDAGDPNAQVILNVIKRHGIHPQLWVMGSGTPTKSDADRAQRTEQEAERIGKIVELAAPFSCKVELYNHNGWFGQPDNEVAVIERLRQKGVSDVGMVYNFSHGHGDISDFPVIWRRIKRYVVAVNVSGMVTSERLIPPSQGDYELEMLRTIQQSGWLGPVGLIAEQGGDAEVTLGNDLRGIDWLRKEIAHTGSGGPRPIVLSSTPESK